MIKSDTEDFDGIKYTTTQFGAMRSLELLARLVKTVGPALGALTRLDASTQLASAPELVSALGSLEPTEASSLVKALMANTTALITDEKGMRNVLLASQEAIDSVFSGRVFTMFKVLGFIIKVNFGDFTQGSAPSAPQPQAALAP